MEKYNLNEGNESLKRILLMMNYDNKKTLSENVEINEYYTGSGTKTNEAVRNRGKGLNEINSVLEGLSPVPHNKLPASSDGSPIIAGIRQDINNIHVKSNVGDLYFFVYKPTRYFTEHNWVLNVKNGVSTLGTWNTNSIYLKEPGNITFRNKNFTNEVNLSDLTATPNDGKKSTETKSPGVNWQQCSGPDFKFSCVNKELIAKLQGCIGTKPDGYFGPKTLSALNQVSGFENFTRNDTITTEQIKSICDSKQQAPSTSQQQGAIQTDNQFIDYENEFVDGNF